MKNLFEKTDGPDVLSFVHDLELNINNPNVCENIIRDIESLIQPFPNSYDNSLLFSLRSYNQMDEGLRIRMIQMLLTRYYSRRRVVQRKNK